MDNLGETAGGFFRLLWIKTPAIIFFCRYIYPTMATAQEKRLDEATRVFRDARGILRTGEALKRGIHPRTLYAMRDAGLLERLERGLYRLAELDPLSAPDLVTVALKIPDGVICLISALSFHDITTQIPHTVHVAIKRGAAAHFVSADQDLLVFGGAIHVGHRNPCDGSCPYTCLQPGKDAGRLLQIPAQDRYGHGS